MEDFVGEEGGGRPAPEQLFLSQPARTGAAPTVRILAGFAAFGFARYTRRHAGGGWR